MSGRWRTLQQNRGAALGSPRVASELQGREVRSLAAAREGDGLRGPRGPERLEGPGAQFPLTTEQQHQREKVQPQRALLHGQLDSGGLVPVWARWSGMGCGAEPREPPPSGPSQSRAPSLRPGHAPLTPEVGGTAQNAHHPSD